jgi:predicted nuclease of predicted toxin-antitoxin system
VKLLLDENLSDRIVAQILDLYPNSSHVKLLGLTQANDTLIWAFAQQHGYTIVSKDADFHQRSLVFGHPPKLIYLRVATARPIGSPSCYVQTTPSYQHSTLI